MNEITVDNKTFHLEEEVKYKVDGCLYFIKKISSAGRYITLRNRGGIEIEVKSCYLSKLKK